MQHCDVFELEIRFSTRQPYSQEIADRASQNLLIQQQVAKSFAQENEMFFKSILVPQGTKKSH